jgi:hypothetical protein
VVFIYKSFSHKSQSNHHIVTFRAKEMIDVALNYLEAENLNLSYASSDTAGRNAMIYFSLSAFFEPDSTIGC